MRWLRQVRITFADEVDAAPFSELDGVVDAEASVRSIALTTRGGIDAIIKLPARHEVVDVVSQQADLEAVFLDFYRGDVIGDDEGVDPTRAAD